MFTSLAIEDVFETSIVQQCRMLESNLGTKILAQCLTDPENTTHTVKSNRDHLLDKDYSHLLFLASHRQGSTVLVAHVASQISWRRLWDIALDRGVKGTQTFQSLFKELSRPISCFSVVKLLTVSHVSNMPTPHTLISWKTSHVKTSYQSLVRESLTPF